MRSLPLLVATLVLFSGCLDFLDETEENETPIASANYEGNGPFEPNEDIVFTGKGSTDADGDVLEYYWDFDSNDGKEERRIGDMNNGRIEHSFSNEGTYTITLTVSDGRDSAIDTVKVTIEEKKSDIKAIVKTDDETETKVGNGEQVTFTFSARESVSETSITKYEWDFSYDSSDGFQVDEETKDYEVSKDFDSGVYDIKVRITNEAGETDESSQSDSVEIQINYVYENTRSINSGQDEHPVQVYTDVFNGLKYIRATLEYETSSLHEDDLDLYLYNKTQDRNPDEDEGNNQDEECNECVAKNYTHDTDNNEQINFIEVKYYNATERQWFDEANELGDWFIVIDQERGNAEYTIKIEVIYWE